jgi:uncharacterized protein (UPF0305 family)
MTEALLNIDQHTEIAVDPAGLEAMSDAIVRVFESAAENRIDETTLRQALGLLIPTVEHVNHSPVTVSNSTFTGSSGSGVRLKADPDSEPEWT